ncbi:MAG: hypothetical protein ACRDKJ_01575 [Actinomycetota bacterium]
MATAFVAAAAREAAGDLRDLGDVNDSEMSRYVHEILHLPELDLSLHVRLPRLLPPAVERLCGALAADDLDAFDRSLPEALRLVDTPSNRERLARSVVRLRDDDVIDRDVAALALVDLTERKSVLLVGSLVQSLAVSTGTDRTPAGLHVARSSSADDARAASSMSEGFQAIFG